MTTVIIMLSFEEKANKKSERLNLRFKTFWTVIVLAQLFRVADGK
jgi:hypothetical protein